MLSQIWGKVGKLLGGVFLAGGGTASLGILLGIWLGHPGGAFLTVLMTLLVIFGLVPTAIGGLLLYSSFKADHHAIRDRFFQLLQTHQGRMSVMDFAMATRLEPAIARRHLDGWAREFSAHFEVTDHGDIYYIFTPQQMALPESRWQVVGQAVGQTVREFLRAL